MLDAVSMFTKLVDLNVQDLGSMLMCTVTLSIGCFLVCLEFPSLEGTPAHRQSKEPIIPACCLVGT